MQEDGQRTHASEVEREDFLFHLYRGSELLQDDRVHEAKQELEQALAFQPRDPKGQDLLGIVYFRLGLYPRAISIYEALIDMYPQAMTPRINLALCYLKTGQAARARIELETVISRDPSHTRAWGYLGLAFQRLGDLERAIAAFQEGGHHNMALRLASSSRRPSEAAPPSSRVDEEGSREWAARIGFGTFEELERAVDGPLTTDASRPSASPGVWSTVEPGRVVSIRAPSSMPSMPSMPPPPTVGDPTEAPSPSTTDDERPRRAPTNVDFAFSEALIVFPRALEVALHASGNALVRSNRSVAVRLDVVRSMSYSADVAMRALPRKSRGRDMEELVGHPGPAVTELDGSGSIVIGPPPGSELLALALTEGPLTVRESAVMCLIGTVAYENARLPGGDGDYVSMIQLRAGAPEPCYVVIALPKHYFSLETESQKPMITRVHAVLGWTGRIVPTGLSQSESPGRARGMVSLRGEGKILLDGR